MLLQVLLRRQQVIMHHNHKHSTDATSGLLVFVPDSEQTISAGTQLTYELRGTVGGIVVNSNSLDVSILTPYFGGNWYGLRNWYHGIVHQPSDTQRQPPIGRTLPHQHLAAHCRQYVSDDLTECINIDFVVVRLRVRLPCYPWHLPHRHPWAVLRSRANGSSDLLALCEGSVVRQPWHKWR